MPAMIIRSYQGWFQMLYIDLPCSWRPRFNIQLLSGFAKELFPKHWLRALLFCRC